MINLNLFDIAVVSIILLSSLLAFFRGFTRELFSILSWVTAIILSYVLGPIVVDSFFADSQYSRILVDIGVRTVLFTVILIIVSITASKISSAISEKIPSSIDKSLGFAAGFAKAYFVIAIFFSIILSFYSHEKIAPKDKKSEKNGNEVTDNKKRVGPEWLKKSASYGFLQFGAETMDPVTKAAIGIIKKSDNVSINYEDIENKRPDKVLEKLQNIEGFDELKEDLKSQKGYSKKDIKKLDHLIDVIDDE